MNHRARISPDHPSGQAMVEFALIIPLLFLLMVIIIDFGRALYVQVALQNGAREGVRFGIVHPTWVTAADRANPGNIVYRASTEPGATVAASDSTITCTTAAGSVAIASTTGPQSSAYINCAVSGSRLEVRITSRFIPLTPLISTVVGSNLTLTGDAVMTIE